MSGPREPDKIVRALRAAHLHDASRVELLQLACDRLRRLGAPFTSVYAYMLRDREEGEARELVLEAFSGRETEHTRIAVGQGVCGTAVATGEDQNVPDVAAIGNYLACNLETKSELVVLIRRGETTLGQLDIDSDVPAGFSEAHHTAVKQVADALAVLL
jgi:L-methionine (R)-S-oxide reductase